MQQVAAGTGGHALPADPSDLSALDGLVARAEELTGPLDLLVSNAATVPAGPFHQLSAEQPRGVMVTNLLSHMELYRQALPGMLERRRCGLAMIGSLAGEVAQIFGRRMRGSWSVSDSRGRC